MSLCSSRGNSTGHGQVIIPELSANATFPSRQQIAIMSDVHQPTLAKLDSTNYMVWVTRMEDLLVGKDLLDAVNPSFLAGTPSPEDIRKDRKAFLLLRTYVSDTLIHYLATSMTAVDAWLILSDLNLSNSYSKIRALIKAVVCLSLHRGECINDFIGRAMSLLLSLRLANEPISEMLMVTAILGVLPREYATIITILEAEDSTLTISSIQFKLCAMEQTICDNLTPDALALSAGRSSAVCEHCLKPGHSTEYCWIKFPALRPAHVTPPTQATASALSARVPDRPYIR
jgi:hypothetical protein